MIRWVPAVLFCLCGAEALAQPPQDLEDSPLAAAAACAAFDPQQCEPLATLIAAGDESLPVTLDALGAADRKVRATAARLLSRPELGPAQTRAEAVEKRLQQLDAPLRGEAIEALGRIGAPRSLAVVVEAAGSEDGRTRTYAANALGRFGPGAEVVSTLIRMLDDEATRVQFSAASNLGRLAVPAGVAPLIDRALHRKTAVFVREACAEALGASKDGRALAPLLILAGDTAVAVRSAALRALGALGDGAIVPALLAMPDEEVTRMAAMTAFAALQDRRAVTRLLSIAVRRGLSATHRTRALWILGDWKATEAVDRLLPLLEDPDAAVLRAGIEALGRIGASRAAASLVPLVEHPDEQIRKSATWSLQQVTGKKLGPDAAAWRAALGRR